MRAHAHVPTSAIGLIVVAVLCFTILDATVKLLSERYPVPLLVWARYTVQLLEVLAAKTKGNRSKDEDEYLNGMLNDFRARLAKLG